MFCYRYLLDYPRNSTKVDGRAKNEKAQDALDVSEAIQFQDAVKVLRKARKAPGCLSVSSNPRMLPGGYIACVIICLVVYLVWIRRVTTESHPTLNIISLVMAVVWLANWRRTSMAEPGSAATTAARDDLRRRLVDGEGGTVAAEDVCYTCTIVKVGGPEQLRVPVALRLNRFCARNHFFLLWLLSRSACHGWDAASLLPHAPNQPLPPATPLPATHPPPCPPPCPVVALASLRA